MRKKEKKPGKRAEKKPGKKAEKKGQPEGRPAYFRSDRDRFHISGFQMFVGFLHPVLPFHPQDVLQQHVPGILHAEALVSQIEKQFGNKIRKLPLQADKQNKVDGYFFLGIVEPSV